MYSHSLSAIMKLSVMSAYGGCLCYELFEMMASTKRLCRQCISLGFTRAHVRLLRKARHAQ